jgi:hypothetical protein
MNVSRRGFLGLLAAPAIIRLPGILMPVRSFLIEPIPGWLECNGAAIPRSHYPDLFATIGQAYGPGPAGKVQLPDLRAHFADPVPGAELFVQPISYIIRTKPDALIPVGTIMPYARSPK